MLQGLCDRVLEVLERYLARWRRRLGKWGVFVRRMRRPIIVGFIFAAAAASGVCAAAANARMNRRIADLERRMRGVEAAFPDRIKEARELLGGKP